LTSARILASVASSIAVRVHAIGACGRDPREHRKVDFSLSAHLFYCLTSKRQPVRERRCSDDPAEVLAHDRCGSEAALFRDSFDRQTGRFQQLLRAANPHARNPGGWSGSDLLTEAAAQAPGTHRRAPSEYRQRQVTAKVPVDPCQE
jgi:hypothetical protein